MSKRSERKPVSDLALAQAARLLRTPLLDESAVRRARVRAAIDGRRTRPRARWSLKPAVIVAFVVGGLAVAGAAVGRAPLARAWRSLWSQPGEPRVSSAHREPKIAVPALASAAPPATAPVTPARSAVRRSPVARIDRATATEAPAPPPSIAPEVEAAPPDEARPVYLALHALRVERDPERAAALAEDYLGRFADSALIEDALAIAIEARASRNDARAAELAARYLARYPRGRHQALARQTLSLFSR